ncbi:FapA family protein, partial [bacterium]|nr:FapA family protein [bacterium]
MEEIRGREAVIRLTAPKKDGKPPTLKNVLSALEAQGIIYGIDEPAIISAIKKAQYNLPIKVALAKTEAKGEPAKYIYRFGIRDERATQPQDRCETIPGQILAVKSPPECGKSGISVFGEEIPGALGDDFSITPGKNTHLSEDGQILYATGFGEANWTDNRCDVQRVLRISGNLSEDLSFDGRVIVSGKILKNVKVSVSDLYVKGDIEGGVNITAEGTLETEGDILGEKGKEVIINAKCDIIANSASYTTLKAGGCVLISTGLSNCHTEASSVIVVGRKGVTMTKTTPHPSVLSLPIAIAKGVQGLTGGSTFAKERIEADVIGSVSLEPTEIKCEQGGLVSSAGCIYPNVKITIGGKLLEVTKQIEIGTIKEEKQALQVFPYEQRKVSLTYPEYIPSSLTSPPSILTESIREAKRFIPEELDSILIPVEGKAIYLCFPQGGKGPWEATREKIEAEKQREETRPASLIIDNSEEGLFITITPPGERGKPIDVAEIQERLKHFFSIDEKKLTEALSEEAGIPIKVAERQYIPEIDGRLELDIREAEGIPNFEAYLLISLPKIGAKPILPRVIAQLLKEKGITYGLLIKRIQALLKSSIRNRPILIAKGKQPTKGEPAKYIYRFGIRNESQTNPQDRLEVIPGQILAVKSPPEPGSPGISVFGETIPGLLGDDFSITPGKNTRLSNDSRVLYAADTGEANWTENRCDVERVLRILGDLSKDLSFEGKVIVSGKISSGVKVSVFDLLVKRDIASDVNIASEGRVETEGDILGSKGKEVIINAKCDIIANSASYAILKTEGCVLISTGLSNCHTEASSVIVVGRKGVTMTKGTPHPSAFSLPIAIAKGVQGLTGGITFAKERIEADVIGSVSLEPTEIRCEQNGLVSSTSCIYPNVKITIGGKLLEVTKQIETGTIKEEKQTLQVFPYEQREVSFTYLEYKPPQDLFLPSILTESIREAKRFIPEELDSILIPVEGKAFYLCFPQGKNGPWDMLKIEKERQMEKERDGSFIIDNAEDGLFITITPPGERGKRVEGLEVRERLS